MVNGSIRSLHRRAPFRKRNGFVPTIIEPLGKETMDSLEARMVERIGHLTARGFDREQLLAQSQLSPVTCCLINLPPRLSENCIRGSAILGQGRPHCG